MIGIQFNFVPPTVTDQSILDQWWFTRTRKLIFAQPWIFDFFKNSVNNELISNTAYEAPDDEFDYNTSWSTTYFSPDMESAQTWTTSSEFLQFLDLWQSNGFTCTVTILENVNIENFSLPTGDPVWPVAEGDTFMGFAWGQPEPD